MQARKMTTRCGAN